MNLSDKPVFITTLQQVHAYYRVDLSEWAISVWWDALKTFDLMAIRDALGRHAVNPDTGQFCPRVADVVKMMQGTSLDGALLAWAKVERAIGRVGPWQTVVFDDALIHRVIDDMGGWVPVCSVGGDELPFKAKEFENRYRGYAHRMQKPEYPAKLLGISEARNVAAGTTKDRNGKIVDIPQLIGDPVKAAAVLERGSETAQLTVTPLAKFANQVFAELESPHA